MQVLGTQGIRNVCVKNNKPYSLIKCIHRTSRNMHSLKSFRFSIHTNLAADDSLQSIV